MGRRLNLPDSCKKIIYQKKKKSTRRLWKNRKRIGNIMQSMFWKQKLNFLQLCYWMFTCSYFHPINLMLCRVDVLIHTGSHKIAVSAANEWLWTTHNIFHIKVNKRFTLNIRSKTKANSKSLVAGLHISNYSV